MLWQLCEVTKVVGPDPQPFYLLVALWPSEGAYREAEKAYPTDPAICEKHPYLLTDFVADDLQNDEVEKIVIPYAAQADMWRWSGDDTYRLEFALLVGGREAPKGRRIQYPSREGYMMHSQLRQMLGKVNGLA